MDNFPRRLLAITSGCREDMHEPDEQGLEARVVGFKLDNAMGEELDIDACMHGYQEIVVFLKRHDQGGEAFNLATLIALARKGARGLIGEQHKLESPTDSLHPCPGAPGAFCGMEECEGGKKCMVKKS